MSELDRRTFLLSTGSITTLGFTGTSAWARATASSSPADALVAAMASPPSASRPQIRWWWPGGAVQAPEVRAEVRAMADAGFGGFEIADVRDSVMARIDPRTHGWASPAWNEAMTAAVEEALHRGITPSLTMGPHWPTGIPGVLPDDDAAAKELVHGMARLNAGESLTGPVPQPLLAKPSGWQAVANEHPPVTNRLVAVQAFRQLGETDKAVPLLDPASMVDLTASVSGGVVHWQAPADGTWIVLAFWQRGTGQIQNMFGMNKSGAMLADPVPYVLDIYGKAAVKALTSFWDTRILTPDLRAMLRRAGGVFFEDSLEMAAACAWTPAILPEFARRQGYDLAPYLALLVSHQPTMMDMVLGSGHPQLFEMRGVDARRVRHDFEEVLTRMYIENRIGGINTWAATLGMRFRVQAVGSEINSGLAAAFAQMPEGDNSNDIHGWRSMAAGRDIGGAKILSDEAGTFVKGIAHVATWRDLIYMLQRDMAGGANQVVIHGFSYADAPGAIWPGFSAFGRSIGNDWGQRDPNWTMAPLMTAALGRMQHLLRHGVMQADLAVLGAPLRSQSVLHAGYTFQYPAMELFEHPAMALRAGRLAPDGPAYRAAVLNMLDGIDLAVVERLAGFAAAGFPVVVVGKPPRRGRGWAHASRVDAQISAAIDRLLALPHVRQVAAQRDVPAALAALGVSGSIGFSAPDRVLAVHRRDAAADVYYLLNDADTSVDQTISLALEGIPYQVNLWTGAISEVSGWRRDGVGLLMPLKLAPNEAAAIVVARKRIAGIGQPLSGTLSGMVAKRAVPLSSWAVELEDWLPGASPSETVKQRTALPMEHLVPWSALAGRQGMAGTARYRAVLEIDAAPLAAAEIDLGAVGGTASVSVNGSPHQAVNPFTLRAHIGPWLKVGRNLVEVMVASPLNNRLLANGIGEEGFKPPVDAATGSALPPMPSPPPEPVRPADPDMVDGPSGLTGMQPGAAPPGAKRRYMDCGLLGPVVVRL